MRSFFSLVSSALFLFLSALLADCALAEGLPGYGEPLMGAGPVSGRVEMEFDLSRYPAGQQVRLWIPYPESDRWQQVYGFSIMGDYDYAAVHTDRRFQNPILYVEWNPGHKKRHLTFSFSVERMERHDGYEGGAQEPCWSPADWRRYLAATSLAPVSGPVAELAARITRGCSSVHEKARAIYDWICDTLRRDPAVRGCGAGDVCVVLDRKGGKCVDIHSVFVALARAAGVPAREVFGLRLGRSGQADITSGYHCWAEYYQPGFGWVVVDPADVTKAVLERDLDRRSHEVMRLRQYYWGSVDPYRIRLSYGRDLVLNPKQTGGPVNYLMYPFAQAGGKTLDWLDPAGFSYRITWRPGNGPASGEGTGP